MNGTRPAKEQANLDVNFEKIRIITTPTLQAGARIEGLSVKLPDGSELLTTQMARARVSIPALFTLVCAVFLRVTLAVATCGTLRVVLMLLRGACVR